MYTLSMKTVIMAIASWDVRGASEWGDRWRRAWHPWRAPRMAGLRRDGCFICKDFVMILCLTLSDVYGRTSRLIEM